MYVALGRYVIVLEPAPHRYGGSCPLLGGAREWQWPVLYGYVEHGRESCQCCQGSASRPSCWLDIYQLVPKQDVPSQDVTWQLGLVTWTMAGCRKVLWDRAVLPGPTEGLHMCHGQGRCEHSHSCRCWSATHIQAQEKWESSGSQSSSSSLQSATSIAA